MKPITELWTPVLINDGIFKDDYLVSNMGRVKQKHTYKNGNCQFVLVNIINSKRPAVRMVGNGKEYRKSLAKLVLSSFHWRDGCECANITYLDGDMTNCRLSNLMYTADYSAYAKSDAESKARYNRRRYVRSRQKMMKSTPAIKSCSTCFRNPCFSGMENLSSDFGAEGCRKYTPREDAKR